MKEYELVNAIIGLLEKQKKEYLIKVGSFEEAYLNRYKDEDRYIISDSEQDDNFKTHFTIEEIVELIKADVIYLDWSKVKFEEVRKK